MHKIPKKKHYKLLLFLVLILPFLAGIVYFGGFKYKIYADFVGDNQTINGGVIGHVIGDNNTINGGVSGCIVGNGNHVVSAGIGGSVRGNNNIVEGGVTGNVVGTGNITGPVSNILLITCPTPPPTPTPTLTPTPTPTPTATPTTYTIDGSVFYDENNNGRKDTGETNYQGTPSISVSRGTVTTRPDGTYTISNLTAGSVTVSVTSLPPGYKMTYPLNGPPPSFQVTVGPGCNTNGALGAVCQ